MANPLLNVPDYGQSIWLDYIRRKMLDSGELKKLIEQDGIRGVTVNPSILEKAITGSDDYNEEIHRLVLEGFEPDEIYEKLAIEDVRRAADLFRPLFDRTGGKHGFVSLELSPHLARDEDGSLRQARRYWKELDRPNVMIKVPATKEGLKVIERLTREGINVNVTLLFGLPRYRMVVNSYLNGLRIRMEAGEPLSHVNSVASFFLSRFDVLVDPILEAKRSQGGEIAEIVEELHGQVAIASARVAYQIYNELFIEGKLFKQLKEKGARPQRLLWASTGTKNPEYSDVKYVDTLIGPDTVNTVPPETLNAYRDHGDPQPRLEQDMDGACEILDDLAKVGIDIDDVTDQLEQEGVEKFNRSYDHLMDALEEKRQELHAQPLDREIFHLGAYRGFVSQRIDELQETRLAQRLWEKDPSLWKGDEKDQAEIRNSLGWLNVAEKMEENLNEIQDFAQEIRAIGYRHVVLLGMGGSSLAPLVMSQIFAGVQEIPSFHVLDTTAPDAIRALEQSISIADTLFISASKSGTTAETRALTDYFLDRLGAQAGVRPGEHFAAITDPGSPLVNFAHQQNYRRVFLNFRDIGGRYSAMSYFGLVPAALMGVDVESLIDRAQHMLYACAPSVDIEKNPGIQLGAALGELGLRGRDKVTFLAEEPLDKLGMWLEQLIAESTGKEGKGLLPVAGEPLGEPESYGDDRFFIHLSLRGEEDKNFTQRVEALRQHGHPMVSIYLKDREDIAQEFMRWEIAVAVAGSIMGINAFNQPNVQESKDNTNRILDQIRNGDALPEEIPSLQEREMRIYYTGSKKNLEGALSEFFAPAHADDYIALMAFLPENPSTEHALRQLWTAISSRSPLAATFGYGPRFLHSTGQFHKGGPNNGFFIQITSDRQARVDVPGEPYDFGAFIRAQAVGDLEALREHERRVMSIVVRGDIESNLGRITQAIQDVLGAMHIRQVR